MPVNNKIISVGASAPTEEVNYEAAAELVVELQRVGYDVKTATKMVARAIPGADVKLYAVTLYEVHTSVRYVLDVAPNGKSGPKRDLVARVVDAAADVDECSSDYSDTLEDAYEVFEIDGDDAKPVASREPDIS